MKKIVLLFLTATSFVTAYSQSTGILNFPIKSDLESYKFDTEILKTSAQIFGLVQDSDTSNINLDGISSVIKNNYYEILKSKDVFHLLSTTSLNTSSELLSQLQASQKFHFLLKVKNQDFYQKSTEEPNLKNIGFDLSVSANMSYLKPSGIKSDSIQLESLMFSDAANSGFSITPVLYWRTSQKNSIIHRVSSEGSFSLRQNKINNVGIYDSLGVLTGSKTINFSVLNFNLIPLKYEMFYVVQDFSFGINISPYINFFNIPNEDADNFNSLFPVNSPLFSNTKNSLMTSLGVKISTDINGFVFFLDMRNNWVENEINNQIKDNNPYKGFVFNAGIAQNLCIFRR